MISPRPSSRNQPQEKNEYKKMAMKKNNGYIGNQNAKKANPKKGNISFRTHHKPRWVREAARRGQTLTAFIEDAINKQLEKLN